MITTILSSDTPHFFETLIKLCKDKGFDVIETDYENRLIKGCKYKLLPWKTLYLELQLFGFATPDDDVIKISVKIFHRKQLQPLLEEKFINSIVKSI